MTVLVLAETDANGIIPQSRNAVTAALAIDSDVHMLVTGAQCSSHADAASKIAGVSKVLKADDAAQGPDPYLKKLNRLYTASDPYFGRNFNR